MVEEFHYLKAGVIFSVMQAVVAVPVTDYSLLCESDEFGVFHQESAIKLGVQIGDVVPYRVEDLNHIFPDKPDDKRRNPLVIRGNTRCFRG